MRRPSVDPHHLNSSKGGQLKAFCDGSVLQGGECGHPAEAVEEVEDQNQTQSAVLNAHFNGDRSALRGGDPGDPPSRPTQCQCQCIQQGHGRKDQADVGDEVVEVAGEGNPV